MSVVITGLSPETESQYQEFLLTIPGALLYHSLKYRDFLRQVLGHHARDRYLLAYEDGELVAALPAFVKYGPFRAVVNSLPFYGSNGSVVSTDKCSHAVKAELLNRFVSMCGQEGAITSTIIQNPLAREEQVFRGYEPDFIDERIGQLTPLPSGVLAEDLADSLMHTFHRKTRNHIRKGETSNFTIECGDNSDNLPELYALHQANMQAVGGLAKSRAVFDAIKDTFEYDLDYRIYTARHNGTVAAAVLVFFFNNTAEYFIPATHVEYRSRQPLSYLIFLAIQDAVARGCTWWNWGGTWLSQKGVYDFKSRWGTKDVHYSYYIKLHSDPARLRQASKHDLLSFYPNFYVLPFSELT